MDGKVDTTFTLLGSGFDNNVKSLDLQTDGKIVVGGTFTSYNDGSSHLCIGIARLNTNGTFDTTFNSSGTGFDNIVSFLIIQTDGKIVVGGDFTAYNDGSGHACIGIARLNTDGTFDNTFVNGPGIGFNAVVSSLIIQTDGKIIAGGNFTAYNDGSAHVCTKIARLNTDGTFDTTFNSSGTGFDVTVSSLILQTDGKIVVGGSFTSYNDGSAHVCNSIARLNIDGTFDNTFNGSGTGFDSFVSALALQTDGKIVVGGDFASYNDGSAHACSAIARLNTNGTFDTTFVNGVGTGSNGGVLSIALQTDGKIVVGGNLTSYNDGTVHVCSMIARLNTNGTFDTTFINGPGTGFNSGPASSSAIQTDGKIVVGGIFTSYNDGTAYSCGNIIRLLVTAPVPPVPLKPFQGENFSVTRRIKVSSLVVFNTFKLPVSQSPSQEAGSVSISTNGSSMLVRKPDGSVGSVVIT